MNLSSTLTASLLISLGISLTVEAAGSIYVREKDVSVECVIPATVGDHIVSSYGCTNDQAYTTRLLNVDSALSITYFDDKSSSGCLDNQGWEIEIPTIKQPTTTPPLEYLNIEALAGVPNGEIVVPGVRKVRFLSGGTIHGHLSCIRIERK